MNTILFKNVKLRPGDLIFLDGEKKKIYKLHNELIKMLYVNNVPYCVCIDWSVNTGAI